MTTSSLQCLLLLIAYVTSDPSPLVGLCATCISAALGGSNSSKQRSFIVLGELCDNLHILPKNILTATVTYQNINKDNIEISLQEVPRTCFDISLRHLELPTTDHTRSTVPRAISSLCGSLICIPSLTTDALSILRNCLSDEPNIVIATLKGLRRLLEAEEVQILKKILY